MITISKMYNDKQLLLGLIGKIRFKVSTQRFCNCLLATNYVTRKVAYLSKEIASFFSKKRALLLPKYESTFMTNKEGTEKMSPEKTILKHFIFIY